VKHIQDALHCPVLFTTYLDGPAVIAFVPVEVFLVQNLTKTFPILQKAVLINPLV
jgi:hypothetical protein